MNRGDRIRSLISALLFNAWISEQIGVKSMLDTLMELQSSEGSTIE